MKKLLLLFFLVVAIGTINAQTCSAKTKAGTECTRKVSKAGDKCWQHGGQTKAEKSGSSAASVTASTATCGATTKAGGKCKNRVKPGQRCHLHKA